jgi:CBS domain-containing protein
MKTIAIKDLMVPLSEYATVPETASLYEAVLALEKAQEEFDHTQYRHRGILVVNRDGHVVGKISQLDILRALEPNYSEIQGQSGFTRLGFTKKFMQSMLESYHLWASPLRDIAARADTTPVSDLMYVPGEGEYVEETASLDEAIHQLVMGHHQSLLVTRDKAITGILRLTDVFAAVFHILKECHTEQS